MLLLHDWEIKPRLWSSVIHVGGLAFRLDNSTNGIDSYFRQCTDSLYWQALPTCQCATSPPLGPLGHFTSLSLSLSLKTCSVGVLRDKSDDASLFAQPSADLPSQSPSWEHIYHNKLLNLQVMVMIEISHHPKQQVQSKTCVVCSFPNLSSRLFHLQRSMPAWSEAVLYMLFS